MENNIPLIDVDIAAKITGTPALRVDTAEYKSKGPDKTGFYWGTGRRKSSVARVRIKPGKGALIVNEKELNDYFRLTEQRNAVVAPLKAMDVQGKFDIYANVQGGGITGQAGAIMLGIARALKDYDIEAVNSLRQGGYLTRDGRMKERKKYGQRGARRRYQFSKR